MLSYVSPLQAVSRTRQGRIRPFQYLYKEAYFIRMDFANEKGCRRKTAKAQRTELYAFFLLVHYILRFYFKEASEIFHCHVHKPSPAFHGGPGYVGSYDAVSCLQKWIIFFDRL